MKVTVSGLAVAVVTLKAPSPGVGLVVMVQVAVVAPPLILASLNMNAPLSEHKIVSAPASTIGSSLMESAMVSTTEVQVPLPVTVLVNVTIDELISEALGVYIGFSISSSLKVPVPLVVQRMDPLEEDPPVTVYIISEHILAVAGPASTVGADSMVMVTVSIAAVQGAAKSVVNVSM